MTQDKKEIKEINKTRALVIAVGFVVFMAAVSYALPNLLQSVIIRESIFNYASVNDSVLNGNIMNNVNYTNNTYNNNFITNNSVATISDIRTNISAGANLTYNSISGVMNDIRSNYPNASAHAQSHILNGTDHTGLLDVVRIMGLNTLNVTENTNLYFTNARALNAVQATLDGMNSSSATNNTNSINRDNVINSTKLNKTSDESINQSISNPYYIDSRNLTVNDTGLVLNMKFDENSTGSATSTKIYDSSKFANDGTWNGHTVPNWTAGKFGGALQFDGVDDYVKMSSSPNVNNTRNITIEAWVNTNGGITQHIVTFTDTRMRLDANKFHTYMTFSDGVKDFDFNTILSNNVWYNLAITYDGTSIKGYVNGIQESITQAETGTIANSGNNFGIGTDIVGIINHFNGTIDEVRIYNRALSAGEIRALYYSSQFNEKSSFVQTDNFRVVNNSGNTTFNVSAKQTTVFSSIIPSETLANATLDMGAVGKSFNRVYASTFAGGEFADKAPGGYDYSSLWSWDFHSQLKNSSNISEGYNNWSTPNISSDLYYSAVKLNTTNGKWDLASGWDTIESVAIIPADNDLIVDGRLVILGGYKAKVFGNISIGDKLIVSNRSGALTNARGLSIRSLQYTGSFVWVNLPISTNPTQYNKYNSAQGVATTVVAIALEGYNSNNTGIIKVKVLNT